MRKLILICGIVAALSGCIAIVSGCQTRVTCERYPDIYLPIEGVVEVNGVQRVMTIGWQIACGGWCATARSPLYAKEQFKDFGASVASNGVFSVSMGMYERDLSTNAIVMVKTIFDGSANLVDAAAKAYATIQTAGGTTAAGAVGKKIADYFISKGGNVSKSTVTADQSTGTVTVTDGTTCISCDTEGNCSNCSTIR